MGDDERSGSSGLRSGRSHRVTAGSFDQPRVELLGMRFLSDHDLLTDNDSDWTPKGKKFDARAYELKDQRPLSQTKNTHLKIKLHLYFHDFAGRREVKIIGTGGAAHFNFHGTLNIDGKSEWAELEADVPLPDRVHKTQVPPIAWQVQTGGVLYDLGRSLLHELYITFGKPIIPAGSERQVEDGVTLKRMKTAVELVEKTGSDTPHSIVAGLMSNFPITVLQPDIDRDPKKFAPATKLGGPQYFEDVLGGAWPITENINLSGECQAISRFVYGVLHQVGVPGKAETILVYADEGDGGKKALTEQFQRGVDGGIGKSKYMRKRTNKENGDPILGANGRPIEIYEQLQLMSRTPRLFLQPLETEKEIRDSKPNAYEATLKFTDPNGVEKYYPGGMPLQALDSPQEVLQRTFVALVWVSMHGPKNDPFFIVWKIVKGYSFLNIDK